MATARLNRRRYREVISLLKEVIADKKAPQQRRLRAAETLMDVYARHDRTEAAKEARRKAIGPSQAVEQPDTVPESQDESAIAELAAQRFLDSIRQKVNGGTEASA